MNPYLDQDDAWEDFHQNFVLTLRELLASQVSPTYIVKVEARL